MNETELANFRIERLVAAIDRVSEGNKTDFGRRLGYKDGAYVRQMIAGLRPVTEKTIRTIESMRGMKGWFTHANLPVPTAPNSSRTNLWPFHSIDEAKVRGLSGDSLIGLEAAILIAAAQIDLDVKKTD